MITTVRLGAIFVFMCLALISTAVIANAPTDLPYLWELKAAAASFTGIAGLLMNLVRTPADSAAAAKVVAADEKAAATLKVA